MTLKDKKQLLKEYRAAENLLLELGDRQYRWQQLMKKSASPAAKDDIDGIVSDLDRRISALSKMRTQIETAINGIEDYTQRNLMQLRYILGADWDSVAESIGYSRRQTFYLHQKALENLMIT